MGQQFDVISPIDGSVVVSIQEASPAQIEATLDKAQLAFNTWRTTPIAERIEIVEGFVTHLESIQEEIAQSITMCMGRPSRWAAGEVSGTADRARHMASIAEDCLRDLQPKPTPGFDRFIRREALGVVLVLSPWNYPYLTAVNAVVPALLAGNTVVLKHSDQTPLAAEHFRTAFKSAGIPEGVFQILHMDHNATARVLADDRIDHVAFTGSVAGGMAVNRALSGRLGRKRFIGSGMELGGNDPAYVRADANIAHAAANVIEGALFNSGQSCCGVERIYVNQVIADDFIEAAIAEANAYVLDDPRHANTTLGPVVRQRNADGIRAQVAAAISAGAVPLIGAENWLRDQPDTPYIRPQLLTKVDHSMDIMAEETFGPCVGIMIVRDDAHAVDLMNDSAYGLTASIWTPDCDAALSIGNQLQTGTVFLNRCDYRDPALAWTGVKNSGRGVTLSRLGFDHLTRPKSFHFRTEING
jgi:acyl-CoA reductase-like NAD-dependent aldehyde dehydrogenase